MTDLPAIPNHDSASSRQAYLLELASDAIFVCDLNGTISYWNAGAETLYGWPRTEALGQLSHELLQTGFPAPLSEITDQVVREGRWEGELIHTRRDGSKVTVFSRWALERDGEGHPEAILKLNTDVTQRKQEEARQAHLLRQAAAAEARFRGLLEAAPDAIVIASADGRIVLVNRQTEALFGYSRDVLLGQPVERLVPERYRPGHASYRAKYTAAPSVRAMGEGLELFGRRQDGREFPVEISLSPIEVDGAPLVISSIRDVTERKRIQADLERSNRELQEFAYVASHDLQEPLRMISSYTQLLARRYQGKLDQDADEFIGYAVDGARRMQAQIQALLEYARVGQRRVELRPIDSSAMVGQVTHDLGMAIEAAGATIAAGTLPMVTGDPTLLSHLFQNLIANALKFHGAAPPLIEVTAEPAAEPDGRAWVFRVQDNGIGIEPQYAEAVFGLFRRLHSQAEYDGTGIGLAICKRIVEGHGGRIWVESDGAGQGSCFCFTLAPGAPT